MKGSVFTTTRSGLALGFLIGLGAPAACTYKVDLLTQQTPSQATPEHDASVAAYEDTIAAYPETETPDLEILPTCDNELAADASTGDSCAFLESEACLRGLGGSCSVDTAICQGGILRLGTVERSSCDINNTKPKCATQGAPCCLTVWNCGENTSSKPADAVEVCSPGCTQLEPPPGRGFTACPGAAGEGWPGPDAIVACTGNFVCDSFGFPLGANRPAFFTDRLSLIYWCENGVLQEVSLSDEPFWQGPVAL